MWLFLATLCWNSEKAPQEIAEQISELIASDLQSFAIVSSMSGFVNITAKPEWLSKRISILLRDLGLELASIKENLRRGLLRSECRQRDACWTP